MTLEIFGNICGWFFAIWLTWTTRNMPAVLISALKAQKAGLRGVALVHDIKRRMNERKWPTTVAIYAAWFLVPMILSCAPSVVTPTYRK